MARWQRAWVGPADRPLKRDCNSMGRTLHQGSRPRRRIRLPVRSDATVNGHLICTRPIPWQSAPEAWFDPWQSAGGTSGTIHILDHAPPAKQSRTGWPPRSALTFQAVGYKKTASRSEATRRADAPHRHMAGPGRRLQPDSGPAAGNPVWRANVGEASASGIYKGACRRSGKLRTKARCPAPAGFFGLKNRPSRWLQRMIRVVSCAPSSRSLSAACGRDLSPSVNSGAAVTRNLNPSENGPIGNPNPSARNCQGCGPALSRQRGRSGADRLRHWRMTASGRCSLPWYGADLGGVLGSARVGERQLSSVSLIGQRYSIDIVGPGR